MIQRLFAILLLAWGTSFAAEPPSELLTAIARLNRETYGWTTTVETPGAPFTIPPLSGTVREDRSALMTSRSGRQTLRATINEGSPSVAEDGSAPTNRDRAANADLADLLDTRIPAEELKSLVAAATDFSRSADGSFVFPLRENQARPIMERLAKNRSPMAHPTLSNCSGTVQVWLTRDRLTKYVLVTRATLSLPIGKKEIQRRAVVVIENP